MNIIMLGAPGAGKGTQADRISLEYKIPQISTGAILRKELELGTELGLKAKSLMNEGKLVSDEIIMQIMDNRLKKDDCSKGFILDGIPRTVEQAESLSTILGNSNKKIDKVINISVEEDILKKRLLGRRSCGQCKANYNIYFNPPKKEELCDSCGVQLDKRADDNENTINERFKVYNDQTKPLIDYYKNEGNYVEIDGNKEVDQIYKNIVNYLETN